MKFFGVSLLLMVAVVSAVIFMSDASDAPKAAGDAVKPTAEPNIGVLTVTNWASSASDSTIPSGRGGPMPR